MYILWSYENILSLYNNFDSLYRYTYIYNITSEYSQYNNKNTITFSWDQNLDGELSLSLDLSSDSMILSWLKSRLNLSPYLDLSRDLSFSLIFYKTQKPEYAI